MGAEKVLSEKLVLEKTKVRSLGDVQRLDLWGEGLTDISVVAKLSRLQVLALAANNVSSLKALQSCEMLQELYLRKNKVANLRELMSLRTLSALSVLWLRDNPCAQHPYYREFVLHCCPGLRQLDGVEITADERRAAAKRLTTKALDEILGRSASTDAAASPRSKKNFGTGSSLGKTTDAAPSGTPAGISDSTTTIEERNSSGRQVLFTTVATQRAMLLSIVSLLSELSVESLELLQREVQERVEKQKEKLTKYVQEDL